MENLKETYNKLAPKWNQADWGDKGLRKFIKLISGGKVLDLGCGSGIQSKVLQEAGLEVVGVDFAEKMIEEAKKRVPNAEFLVMDILNLDFPPEHFDGIYARASLLHIPKNKIGQVLKDLHKILKRNGIIYVALKEGEGEREVVDEDLGASRFFAFYKEDEIRELLEKMGFQIIETVYEKTKNNLWLQIFANKRQTA
ncbi:MAG: class I SAM-dependent methyltransferase [bacterium]|nr:class I SAM-dependent methyltransferase [bacterium]